MALKVIQRIKAVGPYLLLELFMPGGTAIACVLFLCRRKIGQAANS